VSVLSREVFTGPLPSNTRYTIIIIIIILLLLLLLGVLLQLDMPYISLIAIRILLQKQ
jgi:hypothetical protein